MRERAAEAERRLAELGFNEVRVEACGHEEAVAALAVSDSAWPEVLARSDEVASAVRAAGFRYVTLDLGDGAADGG